MRIQLLFENVSHTFYVLVLYVKGPFSLLSLRMKFKADGSEFYSEPTILERGKQHKYRC
jgi:hypothetical protein